MAQTVQNVTLSLTLPITCHICLGKVMGTAKETGLRTRWPREASEARCWAGTGTGREAPGCEGRLTCELLGGGRPVLGDAGGRGSLGHTGASRSPGLGGLGGLSRPAKSGLESRRRSLHPLQPMQRAALSTAGSPEGVPGLPSATQCDCSGSHGSFFKGLPFSYPHLGGGFCQVFRWHLAPHSLLCC